VIPFVSIRRLASVTLGKMLQTESSSPLDVQANYLRAAHVQPQGQLISFEDDQVMWFSPTELRNSSLKAGDVVIVEGGAGFGRSAVLEQDMRGWGFQNSIIRLRPKAGRAHGRFLDYCLQSALAEGTTSLVCSTATIPHFTAEKVAGFRVPAPTISAQVAIADFLDRETAKIDALTSRHRQLVEQLKGRHAALVDHMVHNGISPVLERKDSGVPWIGSIPTHWTVPRIRNLGSARGGLTFDPAEVVDDSRSGTLVLRAGNIQDGTLNFDDCLYVSTPVPHELLLRKGDLLICSRNGSARLIGKNALIGGQDIDGTWGAFMTVLRSEVNFYLRHVLQSSIFSQQIGLFSTSTINQLTTATLLDMRVPLPPADEQIQIALAIEEEAERVESVIAVARNSLRLLDERRAVLITAAVTGQLDLATGKVA